MAFGEGLHTTPQKGKRTKQMYALAGIGALVVVFLIIRRGSAGAGTSSSDLQAAAQQGAAQQQAADQTALGTPSTFADNGASAANLADSVTQALGGVTDALNNLQTSQGSQSATSAPPDSSGAAITTLGAIAGEAITELGNGSKTSGGGQKTTGGGTKGKLSGGRAPAAGAVPAPFGSKKPPAKPGYDIHGTGAGNWWYVPKPTAGKGKGTTTVKPTGGATKRNGGTKRNTIKPH